MRNIVECKGKIYEVRMKTTSMLWARRLNKDFTINQRKRNEEFIVTKDCTWLEGSIDNIKSKSY